MKAITVISLAALTLGLAACSHQATTSTGAPTATTSTPSTTPTTTASPGQAPVTTIASVSLDCGTSGAASLCNATLTLPDGACRTGTVTFHDGRSGPLVLTKVVRTDVDHDGTPDDVVLLECDLSDPPTVDVIAVGHGLVTGRGATSHALDIAADPSGAVRVQLDNIAGSDGASYARAVPQWRTYRWTGNGFHQTTGPTSFTADTTATKLDLTVSPLRTLPGQQSRTLTETVTVHNNGTTTAADLSVYSVLGLTVAPNAAGCTAVRVSDVDDIERCELGSLAPGATRTVTLAFTAEPDERPDPAAFVQLRLGDQEYAYRQV